MAIVNHDELALMAQKVYDYINFDLGITDPTEIQILINHVKFVNDLSLTDQALLKVNREREEAERKFLAGGFQNGQ